jgi:hypothetical protein
MPLLILAALIFFGLAAFGVINLGKTGGLQAADSGDGEIDVANAMQTNLGEDATVTLNSYSGKWSGATSKSEVYPVYTIFDSDGGERVSDAVANSTTASVGMTLNIYGTGAGNYLDAATCKLTSSRPVCEVNAYPVVDTTNMIVKCYDNTGTTALTADDNTNNTADYAGGNLAAAEQESYYCTIENNVNDKVFRLGAICTYYCGDELDDFELESSGWTETNVPSGKMLDSFLEYDDTNASTSCGYKHCYVPSGKKYIEMLNWEKYPDNDKLHFVADTDDTTQPSANGDSYMGAVFVDYGCEKNEDGGVSCGWFKDDGSDQDPGAIGIDENPESDRYGFTGLDISVSIEPQ